MPSSHAISGRDDASVYQRAPLSMAAAGPLALAECGTDVASVSPQVQEVNVLMKAHPVLIYDQYTIFLRH